MSGFHTDLGWKKLKNLQNVAVDYDVVSKKSEDFIFLHSDNDPYVPMEDASWLAQQLHGKMNVIKG